MKKFKIQLKETGTFLNEFNSLEQAKIELKLYELYDHKDGIYSPDSYEIIENEQEQKKLNKQLN
jgi:hypothetical protein